MIAAAAVMAHAKFGGGRVQYRRPLLYPDGNQCWPLKNELVNILYLSDGGRGKSDPTVSPLNIFLNLTLYNLDLRAIYVLQIYNLELLSSLP